MQTWTAHSVDSLAQRVGGTVVGAGDVKVSNIAAIDEARPTDITFVHSAQYAKRWTASPAAAALVTRVALTDALIADGRPLIVVDDAEQACISILELFLLAPELPAIGTHHSAIVEQGATIGEGTRIGPLVWIGRNTRIGRHCTLFPGVRIYPDASIGDNSTLHANVVVRERCILGRGVLIHQNASIGADGFAYRPDPATGLPAKVPHIGIVNIGDFVEVGANACIDRAKFGVTRIEAHAKIDNLVQIGHNARIGVATLIAGMTGIAGTASVGNGVLIGGQVGIADHVSVGDGARIAAGSILIKDVPEKSSAAGYPAEEGQKALRQWAAVRKLPGLIRSLTGRE